MKTVWKVVLVVLAALLISVGIFLINKNVLHNNIKNKMVTSLVVYSPSFESWGYISPKFTCDWQDVWPWLVVSEIPESAKTLAILVEDPDAPMYRPFVHLLVANIPVSWDSMIVDEDILNQWVLGINDFGVLWWRWPCPPHWHGIHHYWFEVFAFDCDLPVNSWFNIDQFKQILESYKQHLVGFGKTVWIYER